MNLNLEENNDDKEYSAEWDFLIFFYYFFFNSPLCMAHLTW